MKTYTKNILKGIGITIGLLFLIYLAAYIYIATNKGSIIKQIKQEVADKLNGEVQLGNIELTFFSTFPSVSVLIENVSIQDTLFNTHKHPFFRAEKAYAKISLLSVIKKKNPLSGLKIENGHLFIYTDTSGYTNSYLFSPKSKADNKGTGQKTEINDVKLKNVRFTIDDRKKEKLIDFDVYKSTVDIKTLDSSLKIKSQNNILVHNLAFKTRNGSFLKEAHFDGDLDLDYSKNNNTLILHETEVKIKGHPFVISGDFNLAKPAPKFTLKVNTKNLDYEFAKSLLIERTARALSVAKLEKPIDEANTVITGPFNGGNPLVNIQYKVSDNNIQSRFGNFTKCNFTGSYTNELIIGLPRRDPNSRLQFHNFTAEWESLKIVSENIYIDDLVTPMINCDIKTDFNLSQLNNVLGSSTIDLNEGKGSVNLTYSGPLGQNSNKNTLINGKVTFSDGNVIYTPRNIQLKNLNGNIIFKNTDVYVTDLRSNVQGNKISMSGSGKNLLAIMKTNPGKAFLDWHIYSPALNLGNFTTLLQKRAATVVRKKSGSKLGSVAQNLDAVVNQANFHLLVKADQLTYKRFIASNVKASLGLMNENWMLNNVSLSHGGGKMDLSGSLIEKNARFYGANVNVKMQNVDVNKVMYAFNNFGQDGISHENLRGKLSTLAQVSMDIDRELQGTPENMNGFVDFSLKNGALLHYEPMRKIQNVAFKKRNFDEIQFAELKDRFDIKDKEITINRLEIQSTVLTLFVEGVFSLRGNTDISVQVPLSNIKKRDENYTPENKGADAKAGASIFMRGRPGEDGNIQFKLDLFKKFRKDDKDKLEEETKQKSEEKQQEKPLKSGDEKQQ